MCRAILHRLPVQKAFISIDGDNVTEPHLTLRQGAGFFFVLFSCFTAIFTLDLYLRRKSHFSLMRCQSSCKKNRLGCEPATLLPAARVLSGLDICSALLFLPLALCLSHIAALSFQTGGLRGSKKHWHIYNGPVHTANMPYTHAGYTLSQKQKLGSSSRE